MKKEERSCGGCTACCIAYDVPEMQKGANTPCRNLVDGGCGIHLIRPHICRAFLCLWRKGFGEADERPDLSGRILSSYASNSGDFAVLQIACMGESRVSEPEVQEILERFIAENGYMAAVASVTFADGSTMTVRRLAAA